MNRATLVEDEKRWDELARRGGKQQRGPIALRRHEVEELFAAIRTRDEALCRAWRMLAWAVEALDAIAAGDGMEYTAPARGMIEEARALLAEIGTEP